MIDNIETKKRKPRAEPPIDFNDPAVLKWAWDVAEKHPEVLDKWNLYAYVHEDEKWRNDHNVIPLAEALDMMPFPGQPNTPYGEYFNSEKWDAWFLWYCLRLWKKLYTTPGEVADLTGRLEGSVHTGFKTAKQGVMKFSPKDT